MNLLQLLRGARSEADTQRMLNELRYMGLNPNVSIQQTLTGKAESIENSFAGYVRGAYKSNGVIFACMLARLLQFTEARFMFRRIVEGRPQDLFSNNSLRILQTPWPGATTGDLLGRAIQDADLSGNFYCTIRNGALRRMRPDWVSIILGSTSDPQVTADDLDCEVIGYLFHPGGRYDRKPVPLLVDDVAHFAPIPDPEAHYRGMSWLTPIRREIMADGAATTHKLKFFENGATVNMVVSLDPTIKKEQFESWVKLFEEKHAGVANAYRTLYLGGGAEAKPVGSELRQIEFKATQGAGETRIAAAAGVPPVIVGLSEGLQAATYSNYGQARRRFADLTMRPLWRNFAGSMARLIKSPRNAELWYDDRDIAALQEDMKDEAEIQSIQATAIKSLVDAGFAADAVVAAVTSGDLSRLQHTGLFSVQLQPAGSNGNQNSNGQGAPALTQGD